MDGDSFDFDEWATLAKSAPDVFEQRRREQVERLISECRDNRRLRGLQCSIDMERIRAHTAMKSCLRISSLMWDSFLDCQEALNTFVDSGPAAVKNSSLPMRQAKVIYFQRKS